MLGGVIAGFPLCLLCQSLPFRIFNDYLRDRFPTVSSMSNYYFFGSEIGLKLPTSVRRAKEERWKVRRRRCQLVRRGARGDLKDHLEHR